MTVQIIMRDMQHVQSSIFLASQDSVIMTIPGQKLATETHRSSNFGKRERILQRNTERLGQFLFLKAFIGNFLHLRDHIQSRGK